MSDIPTPYTVEWELQHPCGNTFEECNAISNAPWCQLAGKCAGVDHAVGPQMAKTIVDLRIANAALDRVLREDNDE